MRRLFLLVGLSAVVAGCGDATIETTPPATVAVPSTIAGPTGIERLALQDRKGAPVLDLCIDTGPEAGMLAGDLGQRLLAAIAEQVAAVDFTDSDHSAGLVLRAWTLENPGEGIGPVIDAEIPDIIEVIVPQGATGPQAAELRARQAEQRARVPGVQASASELVAALQAAELPATAGSDVLGCISRANASTLGADPARRLLVVLTSLPLDLPQTTDVSGGLDLARQVLVLAYGPDVAARQQAWQATWASLGGRNVFVLNADDALGGPLRLAIEGILG